jgi:hypothetical protein
VHSVYFVYETIGEVLVPGAAGLFLPVEILNETYGILGAVEPAGYGDSFMYLHIKFSFYWGLCVGHKEIKLLTTPSM